MDGGYRWTEGWTVIKEQRVRIQMVTDGQKERTDVPSVPWQPSHPVEGTQVSWPGRRKRKGDEWEVMGTKGWWRRQARFRLRPCPRPCPLPAPAAQKGPFSPRQPLAPPRFPPRQRAGDTVAPWGVSLEPGVPALAKAGGTWVALPTSRLCHVPSW